MTIWKGQWPLVLAMILLFVVGCILALTAGQTWAEVRFNFGIELLGTAVSVFLIDLVVTRHLDRREELRRMPILKIISVRLEEIVCRLVEHLKLIDVSIDHDFGSPAQLVEFLSPDRANEKIEVAPGHFVPRMVRFRATTSFDIKFLRDIYEVTRMDLPPEIAGAILEIVTVDAWTWQSLNYPNPGVDAAWISERRDLLFNHYRSVKTLREWLDRFQRDLAEPVTGRTR